MKTKHELRTSIQHMTIDKLSTVLNAAMTQGVPVSAKVKIVNHRGDPNDQRERDWSELVISWEK